MVILRLLTLELILILDLRKNTANYYKEKDDKGKPGSSHQFDATDLAKKKYFFVVANNETGNIETYPNYYAVTL